MALKLRRIWGDLFAPFGTAAKKREKSRKLKRGFRAASSVKVPFYFSVFSRVSRAAPIGLIAQRLHLAIKIGFSLEADPG
jgi:hypothetical protein